METSNGSAFPVEKQEYVPPYLYRQRINKLELTIMAYDACLNTDMVDRMRKRINDLEMALHTVVAGDPANLVKAGISEEKANGICILLDKKFKVVY